ncbi:MAG: hypothetical protein A2149_08455 [Candidatus Schekmanbacteria bacterium RBG_16_38_11]|uniref:Uncharacterized protein n=1 Tax=Candidatus Schekmanbacteria bacterium RBG_16_38_11 TaxID=1817880 RepID=A0A1F7RYB3_9BACT|nr:MAG: hypothetical protein A2149_08455 [Candidatus Schekmanbacteria bacterium RBG_16_38_11]
MKAVLILYDKHTRPNGNVVEMKIWKVPVTKDKPLGYKYSLAYIVKSRRVIGYDNAEGKRDHKHFREKEDIYNFKNITKLIDDFYKDIIEFERSK